MMIFFETEMLFEDFGLHMVMSFLEQRSPSALCGFL